MTITTYPRIRLNEEFKHYASEEFGGDMVNAVRFRVFGHCCPPSEALKLAFDDLEACSRYCSGDYQPETAELRELASRMIMTDARVRAWEEHNDFS